MADKLKFMFLVQGEGRGHMTQAISLRDLLVKNGHKVVSVMVGKSERRVIPDFFHDKIGVPVSTFESPNFLVDSNNKSLKIGPTISYNLKKGGLFLRNLKKIHQEVKSKKPDVIVNFYDLLGGLYSFFYRPECKFVGIGHQFLVFHPDFELPARRGTDKFLLRLNTNISSLGAHKRLALSFVPMKMIKRKNIVVVPPLLRSEVLSKTSLAGDFFLVYILNAGYGEEIKEWHKNNPHIKLHCFWDQKDAPEELKINENLTFHKINDVKFLDLMSKCKGFVSTAGFESICEAMFLGKPIMMVPTGGHFEQECNAIDAVKAGAGMQNTRFNLSNFLDYLPKHKQDNSGFRKWVEGADTLFLQELTRFS